MKQRLLHAAHGQHVDRTPVWLMRQAGRYLKGYQVLRSKYDFLELCKTPELAVKISLEPYERFGVDGVILFSDIMIPAEAMGAKMAFQPGPIMEHPIATERDVAALKIADPYEKTPFVLETLKILKSEISEETTLIGFSGCPFTTACYLVEGRHAADFPKVKKMMRQRPDLFHALLKKLTDTILNYLKAQMEAGADIVQMFDSATYLLAEKEYLAFAYPYEKRLLDGLKQKSPVILFLRDTQRFLPFIKKSGASVVSVDHHCSLTEARQILGDEAVLQGNLDPELLKSGGKSDIQKAARRILNETRGQKHIFNLGHGVLQGTPMKNVAALIDEVKNSAQ